MLTLSRLLSTLAVLAVLHSDCSAADPTYWADVRPILRKHCTVCHSERKLKEIDVSAGLALDKPELIRKGGKTPVVVPGKPDQSLLVTLLASKDPKRAMPQDADPLEPEKIAVLRKWVELGAPEGTKPADDATSTAVVKSTAKIRKLPITFPGKVVSLSLPIGPLPPVAALAFSPDGKWLASGIYGRVTLWDLSTAKPARVLTNVLGAVNDLKFSPDGKLLAVAGGQPSARGDLRLFDTKDWKLVASLGGHLDVVSSVSFNPKGGQIASASFDKTVRLWDISKPASPKVLHTYTGHSDFVYAVAFAPDGTWYATASKDRGGRVIDAKTGTVKRTLGGMDQEVLTVAVRPDGGQIVTSGFEPQLHWWDTKAVDVPKKASGCSVATNEIVFDTKGGIAVAGGADRTVRIVDAKTFTALGSIATGAIVFAIAIDPDGKRIASGGSDGLVKLWSVSGAPLATLWSGAGDGELGDWLATTPDGNYTGSDALLAKGKWAAPKGGTATAPPSDPAAVAKSLVVDASAAPPAAPPAKPATKKPKKTK